ncbi:MAG: hypothetical protein OJI67_05055, partial [Prosthecobacter sp.]|nr:hypothetical protein [Prosthecobacter sp.]
MTDSKNSAEAFEGDLSLTFTVFSLWLSFDKPCLGKALHVHGVFEKTTAFHRRYRCGAPGSGPGTMRRMALLPF